MSKLTEYLEAARRACEDEAIVAHYVAKLLPKHDSEVREQAMHTACAAIERLADARPNDRLDWSSFVAAVMRAFSDLDAGKKKEKP